jgi:3-oxoadipate enol-lactonase
MMCQQRIGDIDVAWTEAGAGPAVVFIHGLAESRHTWAAQQAAFSHAHTFAYDLRGHGDSTAGSGEGTAEQLSGDLVRFLEEVTGPAICVGFSLGGTVVLGAAAERPDLVRRAIVIGTSSVVGRSAAEYFRGRIAMLESGLDDRFRQALRDDTAGAIANPAVDVDAVTAARLAAVGAGTGYINAATAMARVNAFPLTESLARISRHVDVVGGELDSFCPRKAADLLMSGLQDATYWEIPAVSHLMNIDNPAEVTRLLGSLLEENNQ